MKKFFYLVMLPLFIGCGNTAQQSSSSSGNNDIINAQDSLAVIEGVDSVIVEDIDDVSASDSYSTQDPDVIKTFEVVADAFRYNSASGNFSSRGEYTLRVTLYSDHSLYAVGREGVPMRVQKSLEDKWDYMCAVPGENNYAYFFNTDEIYSN